MTKQLLFKATHSLKLIMNVLVRVLRCVSGWWCAASHPALDVPPGGCPSLHGAARAGVASAVQRLSSGLFPDQDLIENVVAVAENTADELARSDGREVQLEEDPDLQLPFLLPEDGYSCDVVRNIPSGLQEFLDPLCQRGERAPSRASQTHAGPVPRRFLSLVARGVLWSPLGVGTSPVGLFKAAQVWGPEGLSSDPNPDTCSLTVEWLW